MCRLAAFPPGFPREKAEEMMESFGKTNDDGVGVAYIKNGNIKLLKYPIEAGQAIKEHKELFQHMPYDGWTISHVRIGTSGGNTYVNTHPFIFKSSAICHNGMWSGHQAIRHALKGLVKFRGETDSEVAGYLIDRDGAQEFYDLPMSTGVYLQLHKNGSLTALKCTGDLEAAQYDGKIVLASDLAKEYDPIDVSTGWVKFKADGSYDSMKLTRSTGSYQSDGWPKGRQSFSEYHNNYADIFDRYE